VDESLRPCAPVAPAVRLVLDTFCLATAGADLARLVLPPSDRVAAIQIAGWDGHTLRRRLPAPGDPSIVSFIAAARDAGYRCPVSLEVFPLDADAPDDFARSSARSLRGLLGPARAGGEMRRDGHAHR